MTEPSALQRMLERAEQPGQCTEEKDGRDHCPACDRDAAISSLLTLGPRLAEQCEAMAEALRVGIQPAAHAGLPEPAEIRFMGVAAQSLAAYNALEK